MDTYSIRYPRIHQNTEQCCLLLNFQTLVIYAKPTVYTCTARIWLREIGFSLTYGALMLKTWRYLLINLIYERVGRT